jgi:DNA-binding NarL/FixJ family response regulator
VSLTLEPQSGPDLTEREVQILAAAARGLSVSTTGRELYLSPNTVKTYRRTAFRRLGARNVTEAVALAQAYGLLSQDVSRSEQDHPPSARISR